MQKINPRRICGRNGGFTLIELLIVIAVIAIIAGVVMVALNPLGRFQDSRNSRRWSDVNTYASSLKLYQVDNSGAYPVSMDAMSDDQYYQIGIGTNCEIECNSPSISFQPDCVDLSVLSTRGYIGTLPFDPNLTGASADRTGYYIMRATNRSITIGACNEEMGTSDSIRTIEVIK
jgi:prepilin-type N-terminal cleavage/methylation domain-containing protein